MVDPKEETKRAILESRSRIATIAEELARRASPEYVKEQAKEAVIDKTRDAVRPLKNPWVIALAAAATGGVLFLRFGGARARLAREAIMRAGDKIVANKTLQKGAKIALRTAQIAAPVAKMLPKTARVAVKSANETKQAYKTVEEGQRAFKRKHWVSSAIAALVTAGAVAAAVRAQNR